jgi:hypothetical protein
MASKLESPKGRRLMSAALAAIAGIFCDACSSGKSETFHPANRLGARREHGIHTGARDLIEQIVLSSLPSRRGGSQRAMSAAFTASHAVARATMGEDSIRATLRRQGPIGWTANISTADNCDVRLTMGKLPKWDTSPMPPGRASRSSAAECQRFHRRGRGSNCVNK